MKIPTIAFIGLYLLWYLVQFLAVVWSTKQLWTTVAMEIFGENELVFAAIGNGFIELKLCADVARTSNIISSEVQLLFQPLAALSKWLKRHKLLHIRSLWSMSGQRCRKLNFEIPKILREMI